MTHLHEHPVGIVLSLRKTLVDVEMLEASIVVLMAVAVLAASKIKFDKFLKELV